jgi:hypothetical protein
LNRNFFIEPKNFVFCFFGFGALSNTLSYSAAALAALLAARVAAAFFAASERFAFFSSSVSSLCLLFAEPAAEPPELVEALDLGAGGSSLYFSYMATTCSFVGSSSWDSSPASLSMLLTVMGAVPLTATPAALSAAMSSKRCSRTCCVALIHQLPSRFGASAAGAAFATLALPFGWSSAPWPRRRPLMLCIRASCSSTGHVAIRSMVDLMVAILIKLNIMVCVQPLERIFVFNFF